MLLYLSDFLSFLVILEIGNKAAIAKLKDAEIPSLVLKVGLDQ